jgi:hypothetical protein
MNAIDLGSRAVVIRRHPWRRAASGRTTLLRAAIWAAAMLVCLALPSLARAADHRWCVRYKIDAPDRSYGDFGTGQYWLGRGLYALVYTGNGPLGYEAFTASAETGCFEFDSAFTSNMSAFVYYKATIGKPGDYTTVRLEVPVGTIPAISFTNINPSPPGSDGKRTATLTLDSGTNNWDEALAIPAYTLHTLVNAGTHDGHLPSDILVRRGYYGDQNNAVAYREEIGAGSPLRTEKFLLGHEAGHVAGYWLGGPFYVNYFTDYDFGNGQANEQAHLCKWDESSTDNSSVSGHAMRSHEFARAAWNEGYAHFVSAIIWNDRTSETGTFKYYKTLLQYWYNGESYALGATDDWPVDWLHDSAYGCNCSGSPGPTQCEGTGVEIDWLRALWEWGSGAGTRPTLPQVFKSYYATSKRCIPFNFENVGSSFREATWLVSSTQGFRWTTASSPFDLDTTPPGDEATCQ